MATRASKDKLHARYRIEARGVAAAARRNGRRRLGRLPDEACYDTAQRVLSLSISGTPMSTVAAAATSNGSAFVSPPDPIS